MAAYAINRSLTRSVAWGLRLWMKESWGKRRRSLPRRYVVQYHHTHIDGYGAPSPSFATHSYDMSPFSPSIFLTEKEETGMFVSSWDSAAPLFVTHSQIFLSSIWQKKEPSKSKDDKKKQPKKKKKKKKNPWKSKRKEQNQVCIHINISRGAALLFIQLTSVSPPSLSLLQSSLTTHSQRVLPLQWNW